MEKKNYTVAVDLGCSSVVVAVGEKTPEGLLDVACVVTKPVEGVNAGRIENIELVSRAIREAVSEAEQQLGIRITEAYAGISGDFVRCARHTDHVFVYDPQNGVNQKDVDALFDRMRNVQAPDDETIMERVPQNYMVDDNQEVRNPVGSFGKKLSSTFNFILCLKTPMQRLDMALKRLGIKMLGVMSDALATPEAVLLPAVLGIDRRDAAAQLERQAGRPVAMVATLPPSVPGLQAQLQLRRYFQQSGGVYMLGDTAMRYEAEGGRITALYTADHGDIAFEADSYVLATGSYFSQGLVAGMDGVREPLFGLDVACAADRGAWYDRDLFAAQPFELFGVKCDEHLRGLRDGRAVENLYVIGAGLAGFNPVKEGCGAGVSMLTALAAAERILNE